MAIYPILIAVRLRQDCKKNYIFITVRLLYDVAKVSPGLLHNLAKVSPKSRQDCYTISPRMLHNLARIAAQSRQDCYTILPGLLHNLAKISPKSRRGCTTMSPGLAGLLYDLATVALRCFQDSQDCYTISLQLHNDVPRTRKIAVKYRHSCTTMSSPRLTGLLYDNVTVALPCPWPKTLVSWRSLLRPLN